MEEFWFMVKSFGNIVPTLPEFRKFSKPVKVSFQTTFVEKTVFSKAFHDSLKDSTGSVFDGSPHVMAKESRSLIAEGRVKVYSSKSC